MRRDNVFGRVCLCLSVCPVRVLTLESLDIDTSLFGMRVHLRHVCVMFVCQGHRDKVQGQACLCLVRALTF